MRLSLLCGLLALVPLVPGAEEHWRSVKGDSLRTLFQDREFGDGVHFAYQFKAGGVFTGTEMSKEVRDSWRVSKNELCWKWQRLFGSEECYGTLQSGR